MAFSDPQTITISGVTTSLPRVSTRPSGSDYTSADGLITLKADHSSGRRSRHVVRVDHSKVSADVYLPTQNVKHSMSVYTVFDMPPVGYSAAEALAIFTGFNAQLTAVSNALITKLLGGES